MSKNFDYLILLKKDQKPRNGNGSAPFIPKLSLVPSVRPQYLVAIYTVRPQYFVTIYRAICLVGRRDESRPYLCGG